MGRNINHFRPTPEDILENMQKDHELFLGKHQRDLTWVHKQILMDWNSCDSVNEAVKKVDMSLTSLMQHIQRFRRLELNVKTMPSEKGETNNDLDANIHKEKI